MILTRWKKSELRTIIRTILSDQASHKIGDGVLDLLTEATMDALWAEILDRRPYFVSQLDVITQLISPGYIDTVSQLSKRLFRIQDVVRRGRSYAPIDPRHVLLENGELKATNARRNFIYTILGSQIHLFPYEQEPQVEIRYSYLPTRFTLLTEDQTIGWPEGYELALAFAVASKVDPVYREEADRQVSIMFGALPRPYQGPQMPYHSISPQALGGE